MYWVVLHGDRLAESRAGLHRSLLQHRSRFHGSTRRHVVMDQLTLPVLFREIVEGLRGLWLWCWRPEVAFILAAKLVLAHCFFMLSLRIFYSFV